MIKVTIEVRVNDEFVSSDVVIDNDIVRLNSQLEYVIESIRHNLEGKSPLEPRTSKRSRQ
jgi:hypothetical protein